MLCSLTHSLADMLAIGRLHVHRIFCQACCCMLKTIRSGPPRARATLTFSHPSKSCRITGSREQSICKLGIYKSARRKTILWHIALFPGQPDSSGVGCFRYSCAAFFATLMHASSDAAFPIRGLASIQKPSCSEEECSGNTGCTTICMHVDRLTHHTCM